MPAHEFWMVTFGANAGGVTLRFEGRRFGPAPALDEFVRGEVDVREPGAWAAGRFDFFARDLLLFEQALTVVDADLEGDTALESDDGAFRLRVVVTRGEARLEGHLRPHANTRTTLTFVLPADPSYLRLALAELRSGLRNGVWSDRMSGENL